MSALILTQGNALHMPLRDKSIDVVCTSPPYYGLRSYQGVLPSNWPAGSYVPTPGAEPTSIAGWEGCLGNEGTPQAYIYHLILVLHEIKRTLKDAGVVWIVIGDSYSSGDRQGHGTRVGYKQQTNRGMNGTADPVRPLQPEGVKPGSLLGIPGLLHQAALADGWIVRSDVIWSKSSPMPESIHGWRWQQARCGCVQSTRVVNGTQKMPGVGHREHLHTVGLGGTPSTQPDPACPHCGGTGRLAEVVLRQGSWRHTRSHDTILQLTKNMGYFANSEAVREEGSTESHGGGTAHPRRYMALAGRGDGDRSLGIPANVYGGRNSRSVLREPSSPQGVLATLVAWLEEHRPDVLEAYHAAQANPRDVVTSRSANLDLAHYAAFPPALVEPLVKATCPERVCPICQQGWAYCNIDRNDVKFELRDDLTEEEKAFVIRELEKADKAHLWPV